MAHKLLELIKNEKITFNNKTKKDSGSVWHNILIGSGRGSNKYVKQQLEEGKYQKVKSAMVEAMKIKSKKKKGKK